MQPRGVRALARVATRAVLAPLLVLAAIALPVGHAAATVGTPSCSAVGVTVSSLGGPNFYIDGSNPAQFKSGYTGYRVTNATGAALGDVWAQLSGFTGGALGLAANQPAAQRVGDLADGTAAARFWYLTATGESTIAQNHTVTIFTHNPALPNAVALCTTTGGFAAVKGTIGANPNKISSITLSGGTPTLGSTFKITVVGNTGTLGEAPGDPYSFWMTPAVADSWPAGAFRLLTTKLSISPDGTAAVRDYVDILRVASLGATARDYTAVYTFQAVGPTASATAVQPVEEISSGQALKHTDGYPASIPAIPSPVNDLSLALSSGSAKLDLGGGTVILTGTPSGTAGAELDSLALTLPAGATVVPGSSTWGGTPIPNPVTSGGKQIYSGPFTVGSGPLKVRVTFDGTPGNRTLSLSGAIGSTQIGTSTGISTPASAVVNVDTAPTAHDTSVTVPPGSSVQINVAGLMSDADGDPLSLSSTTTPAHGSVEVSGTRITYLASSSYQGDDVFTWTVTDGRGGQASASVNVTVDAEAIPPPPLTSQALTFPTPADLGTGDHEALTATADSGLAVSYLTQTPSVCTVLGDAVTAVAAGNCTVRAEQDGNAAYAAADPVSVTFEVTAPAAQSIDFTQPAGLLVGEHQSLDATGTSGLAVSFASETTDVCAVADDVVTAIGPGSCTVEATQAGDHTHAAASPVSRSFTVTAASVAPAAQSIDFAQPADLVVGDHRTLDATASSGLPVTFGSETTDVCTVAGDVVTALADGDCVVHADQAGDTGHAAADQVNRTLAVTAAVVPPAPPAPAAQTIAFEVPASLLGTAPVTLSATASSGLPVTLAVVAGHCDLVGNTLTPAAPGSCAVEATQAGDSGHAAAPPARRTVSFVVPVDDEAVTDAGTATGIDVLANDPTGVSLRSAARPGHGTATLTGGGVRYSPDAGFSGTDTFSYTVTRDGRTAQASVTVTVGEQRPQLRGGSVRQLAGDTARYDLRTDTTKPSLRITAVPDAAGVSARVEGGTLVLRAAGWASGDITVTVTVTDERGRTATATVRDRVTPPAPRHVGRRLSPAGTVLRWSPAPTHNASYDVLVDGNVVCHTSRTACSLSDVLGPERTVSVRTVGHDATRSVPTGAPLRGHGQVLVTTVYFASGEDALTAQDHRILDAAIREVHRFGFGRANLDGYTDADGGLAFNMVLSHHRTQAVARYLREHGRIGNVQAWHGEADPVASNSETQGKARNRRVEVLVRY